MQNEKIFVQIASYRDPQLRPTIQSMLSNANHPERLTFGICWQHSSNEDPTIFDSQPEQFKVIAVPFEKSKGLGWARCTANTLYSNEPYMLQIDSHHRFSKGWDAMLQDDFDYAQTMCAKPIISSYVTPFTVDDSEYDVTKTSHYTSTPCYMAQYEFSSEHLLMSRPSYISDFRTRTHPLRARTLSAHFLFTSGNFIEEVPYDPEIYFGGYTEEVTLSARAYTTGYDFFSPHRQYIWHEYSRKNRAKHWEDHEKWSVLDCNSKLRTRVLLQQIENQSVSKSLQGFELGSVRSLADYEKFTGIHFKLCFLEKYTIEGHEPPDTTVEKKVKVKTRVRCEWSFQPIIQSVKGTPDTILYMTLTVADYEYAPIIVVSIHTDNDEHSDIFTFDRNFIELEVAINVQSSESEQHIRWILRAYDKNNVCLMCQEGKPVIV